MQFKDFLELVKKKGIDIAKWNEIEDYQEAKNAGVEFAIVKVINAQNKPDGRFNEHVAGCNSAGIPIIAGYTYGYGEDTYLKTEERAKMAAEAFVNTAAQKNIKTMVYDAEDKSLMGFGNDFIRIINIYREAAKAAGMDFIIYTGAQFYNPCIKPYAREIADIPVWWARYPFTKEYTPGMDIPDSKYLPTGIELTGWQYSSKGVVPGIKGYVDLDVWFSGEPAKNTKFEITVKYNPFAEPAVNVKRGSRGNDARWVQWYLWVFGLIRLEEIDGIIGQISEAAIKEAQRRLGLTADGIVGKVTRATWKKVA